jgi:hypothetical protein
MSSAHCVKCKNQAFNLILHPEHVVRGSVNPS